MQSLLSVFALFSYAAVGYGQFTTVLNIPPDPNIGDFQSIGAHTQLNLFDGGVVGMRFNAGVPDEANEKVEMNIFGGTVGDFFNANQGSIVNVSGGMVGSGLQVQFGSRLNVTAGTVARVDKVMRRGEANISGGNVGAITAYLGGGLLNLSGGTVDEIKALMGSFVNIFGTQFVLDGDDITDSFTWNEPLTIDDRDVTLSGRLADGSDFSFDLNSTAVPDQDFFDVGADLVVMRVLPADTNNDGLINIDDLNNVRNNFGETGNADGKLLGDAVPWDGVVDIDDLNVVRNKFGAGATPVPEPSGSVIALLGILTILADRRNRSRLPNAAKPSKSSSP